MRVDKRGKMVYNIIYGWGSSPSKYFKGGCNMNGTEQAYVREVLFRLVGESPEAVKIAYEVAKAMADFCLELPSPSYSDVSQILIKLAEHCDALLDLVHVLARLRMVYFTEGEDRYREELNNILKEVV